MAYNKKDLITQRNKVKNLTGAALSDFSTVLAEGERYAERKAWSTEVESLGMYGLIYRITSLKTGKCYVGQTTRTLRARMSDHISGLKKALSPSADDVEIHPLYKAAAKEGADSMRVDVLDIVWDNENDLEQGLLNKLEKHHIAENRSMAHENGYNLCSGGAGTRDLAEESALRRNVQMANIRHGEQSPYRQALAWCLDQRGVSAKDIKESLDYSSPGKALQSARAAASNPALMELAREIELSGTVRHFITYMPDLIANKTKNIGPNLDDPNAAYANEQCGIYHVSKDSLAALGVLAPKRSRSDEMEL